MEWFVSWLCFCFITTCTLVSEERSTYRRVVEQKQQWPQFSYSPVVMLHCSPVHITLEAIKVYTISIQCVSWGK